MGDVCDAAAPDVSVLNEAAAPKDGDGLSRNDAVHYSDRPAADYFPGVFPSRADEHFDDNCRDVALMVSLDGLCANGWMMLRLQNSRRNSKELNPKTRER